MRTFPLSNFPQLIHIYQIAVDGRAERPNPFHRTTFWYRSQPHKEQQIDQKRWLLGQRDTAKTMDS